MKIRRKHMYNILFWGFVIFLFTPFSLGVRAKMNQGFAYVKGIVDAPSAAAIVDRNALDTYDVHMSAVVNAVDMNLNSLKGKVVFINHWATWCPPCRAEMPSLHNLYTDYGSKIEFIFFTTDPEKKINEYYASNNFNFPTYKQTANIPPQINTRSLPTTYILDKEGKVALKEIGAADWNSNKVRAMLDELLGQ